MDNYVTELLAPAKDKETAIDAINAGADAVYIGAASFGARKNAGNTLEDIKEIIDYAHKYYVKVFVTVNTILTDNEIRQAAELIKQLCEIKADAIIIQDMGLLKLACDGLLPPIPIHISTQCNNRTKEKVKFFETLGIPRVVLARELSIEQIKEISGYAPNIELECFVHGALCVSYSGQCYLSQYIGGRSANRGECAQPCRKKYTLCDKYGNILLKDKYLLSMKDFNASKYLDEMIKAGVKSFKIEGRLKDRNYVKNVTLYYRRLLDKYSIKTSSGKIFTNGFVPDINKTFNRGYTTYFLKKREQCFNFNSPKSIGEKLGKITYSGKNYYNISTVQKLSPQDGLCYFTDKGELKGFAVNRVAGERIFPNNWSDIPVGTIIYRNQDVEFEKQLSASKIIRKIACKITVKDDYLYTIDEDENRIVLPLPVGDIPKNPDKAKENFVNQLSKTGNTDFYIEDLKLEQEIKFYPVSKINEFRRLVFGELMKKRLEKYLRRPDTAALKTAGYPIPAGDYHENVYNKLSESFYKEAGCNIEEYAPEKSAPRGEFELMRTKHCIKWAIRKCKSPEELFLIDDCGQKYPLKFDCKNCEMVVLAPKN